MKFVLLQDQDDQSYMKSRSNIDLSKVKGYLHSMGKSVPENALELLNSVEQYQKVSACSLGAQWLSGRVLDSRQRGRRIEPHRRHCAVVLEQDTFILA